MAPTTSFAPLAEKLAAKVDEVWSELDGQTLLERMFAVFFCGMLCQLIRLCHALDKRAEAAAKAVAPCREPRADERIAASSDAGQLWIPPVCPERPDVAYVPPSGSRPINDTILPSRSAEADHPRLGRRREDVGGRPPPAMTESGQCPWDYRARRALGQRPASIGGLSKNRGFSHPAFARSFRYDMLTLRSRGVGFRPPREIVTVPVG